MGKQFYPYFVTGIVCLAIGIAVGWGLLQSGTQKTDIKMKFGTNELSINLDQDLTDNAAMLSKLFSEDFAKAGTLHWLKEKQQLFQLSDPVVVTRISALDYNDRLSDALRELSQNRLGPWAYQIDTIRIGIPPLAFQPRAGYANVCENGKYLSQNVRIYSLDQTKTIEITATGRYECPGQIRYPDIQLHPDDARALLGRVNFSEYEQGLALILSPR